MLTLGAALPLLASTAAKPESAQRLLPLFNKSKVSLHSSLGAKNE